MHHAIQVSDVITEDCRSIKGKDSEGQQAYDILLCRVERRAKKSRPLPF